MSTLPQKIRLGAGRRPLQTLHGSLFTRSLLSTSLPHGLLSLLVFTLPRTVPLLVLSLRELHSLEPVFSAFIVLLHDTHRVIRFYDAWTGSSALRRVVYPSLRVLGVF